MANGVAITHLFSLSGPKLPPVIRIVSCPLVDRAAPPLSIVTEEIEGGAYEVVASVDSKPLTFTNHTRFYTQ